MRGARPLVLGSQVESRDAATTDVAAIDHCITYDDFCDAHELLLVFTSTVHKLLCSSSANIFFMMGVSVCVWLSLSDFLAPLISPHADRARASAQRAPDCHFYNDIQEGSIGIPPLCSTVPHPVH